MSEEEKIMLETNQSITYMETCFRNKIRELQQENQQLKENLENMNKIVAESWSVLDEIREYINNNTKEEYENIELDEHFGMILQILDKASSNE